MTGQRTHAVAPLLALALGALAACDCGGGTGSVTAGFRTRTTEVDFGKVLEGAEVTRQIELESTGRGDVTVDVSTTGPFEAAPAVLVPGGGTVQLDVTFTAPDGAAEGTLTLSARGETFDISLRGRGVRPLDCVASAPCRVARFVLETERCEETVAEEGSACTPTELCLEDGVCRSGVCVGTPRSCDDQNACTQDACSEDVGCVHIDISAQCPQPVNPCEAPACNPTSGCGTRQRDDGVQCGAVDCKTANLCQSGQCKEVATPEGFLCAPATPCQGEGRCFGGECARPDAGVMTPAWNLPLGDVPDAGVPHASRMLAESGNIYFTACGLPGTDGGCALASYTGNGFLRFSEPVSPEATLHALASFGALVEQGGALDAFALTSGGLQWSVALSSLVAVDAGAPSLPQGGVVVGDGGVTLSLTVHGEDGGTLVPAVIACVDRDGGQMCLEEVADAGPDSALARSASGAEWLYSAAGDALTRSPADGGTGWILLGRFPGDRTLAAVGREGAVFGSTRLVTSDGGVTALLDGGEAPVGFEPLAADGVGFLFFSACRAPFGPSCAAAERAIQVRAFNAATGAPLWETTVLPPLAAGGIVDAALPGGPLTGTVMTLTQAQLSDGLRAHLQLFAQGERAMLCPLAGEVRVLASRFEQGFLYVLVEQSGERRLEAYSLAGIPLTTRGWPRPGGLTGDRTER